MRHALYGARTSVDGLDWFARVTPGHDPRKHLPVILVHGFGISSSYFVPFAERLGTRFDVYAPDLPGHGKSQSAARPLDIPGFAEALRRWMSAMRLARASVIGHSMGCQVAVELAVRYPDVVDRLVLMGPTANGDARSIGRMALRLVAGGGHEPVAMLELIAKDYLRMLPRLRFELDALLAHRIEDRLPRIGAPVLFLRGENDKVAPQRWVEELARLVAGSRIVVVPRWGHALQYAAPDEVVELVTPFLESRASSCPTPGDDGPMTACRSGP